ncbi:MAG: DUF1152 domain-containing protein [Candidatus Methanomethyliaceae archaeon]|nr:DUF1152 domain-containing protein [Candidatus Methanomethyliaceae archaeon]MDW7970261.1 DUF1152 domain-containing protein [Nitrososphaerota archaeon]
MEIGKSVIFIAVGGGGDVASASMLALAARRIGLKSHIASIVWERFSIDRVPGPVKFNEILNAIRIGDYSMLVSEESRALRGGREISFQSANVSRAIGEKIGIVDITRGTIGMEKGIKELAEFFGCDTIIGVDVGGDILSNGFEKDLWSPLADFISLAAISKLDGIIYVHSIGSDGELSQSYLLRRIALIAERGGLLGARGMMKEDAEVLEKILTYVESEASKVALLAFRGYYGYLNLRNNSRRTFVTPLNTLTFFFKAKIISELNPLVPELLNVTSIEEAKHKLNERGVFTELNLEENLFEILNKGGKITGKIIREIKRSFLKNRNNQSK